MAVIENIDVVMGAQTAELDAGVADAVKNLETLKSAANGQTINISGGDALSKNATAISEIANASRAITGDSALSQVASLVDSTTASVERFAVVSKAGSVAAFAFQAGLVAIVATSAFEIGKSITEWLLNTKALNEEIERQKQLYLDVASAASKASTAQFNDDLKTIETIRNPIDREGALTTKFNELSAERLRAEEQYNNAVKNDDETQQAAAAQYLDTITEQRNRLWEMVDPRNKQLELNKLLDAEEQRSRDTRTAAFNEQMGLVQKLVELEKGQYEGQKMALGLKGYNEDEVARLMKLNEQIENQKEIQDKLKSDQEEVKRIKEDTLTAEEKLTEQAMKLQELKDRGMITEDEYAKSLRNAEQRTREDTPDGPSGAVSAQAGSVAAYKLMLERDKGAMEEARKQTTIQERIAKATEESNTRLQNLVNVGNARGG